MSKIQGPNPNFKYLQDARQFALEQKGSERILKTAHGYEVEPLENLAFQSNGIPDLVDWTRFNLKDDLQARLNASGKAETTVEFLIDELEDGNFLSDRQFVVNNGQVSEHEHRLGHASERLLSPENKGLGIVREAMQQRHNQRLLQLTPEMVGALLNAQNLPPEEQQFIDQQFKSPEFQQAQALFVKFHGSQATFAAAGVSTYEGLMQRLNAPENRTNLERVSEIAQRPERFESYYGDQPDTLASMSRTFKALPGFRRSPASLPAPPADQQKLQRREFEHALRTIDQHQYKFRLSHGMQFNQQGVSGYETEVSHRWGDKTLTVGVAGRDYDFNNPFDQENAGHGINQIRAEYRSPDFDVRGGVKRDDDGKFDIISPKSDWADRFIEDRVEQGKGWAQENPWQAAAIAGGIAAGVWGYSYATGADMSVHFDQRFNLINSEHFRLRAEVSPELHLNAGMPDLGLYGVGLGAMGTYGDISYNATLRHRFDNTTLGTGQINSKETDLNTRIAYRQYALETANRWDHNGSNRIQTEVGLRRDFTLSDSSSAYLRPHVQLDNGSYQDVGARAGWSKDFGNGFSLDLNAGYSEKGGPSAGFRTSFQF